jgi:polysaccharide biosynthesis protein PslH
VNGRPSLLFLSPVMPATGGNGLAMRAGVFLDAYASRFDVTLAILPVTGPDPSPSISDFVRRHTRRVEILPFASLLHPHYRLIAGLRDPADRRAALARYAWPQLCSYDAGAAGEMLQERLGAVRFEASHVERLYLAPLAGAGPVARHAILDLDEDDGEVHRAIGRLHALNGEAAAAATAAEQAGKFDRLQRDFLPRFDLVLMAAPGEAARLRVEFPDSRIAVVANAFRAPSMPAARRPASAIGTDYLMVGNLSYYPNADGARFFCRAVLPLIRRAGGRARVALAGQRPGEEVRALAAIPDVSVHAGPADLAPFYADAAVAVVPIRAGGGSRIKILEAFAHGVPVVSTSIGAAGLAAVDGRHLLIADGPEDFAAAALRLHRDAALAAAIATEGRALLESQYRLENSCASIVALVHSLARI